MVNEARETCIDLLSKDRDHRDLVQIAFHHQVITAKPLFEIMRAIVTEIVNVSDNFHYATRKTFGDVLGKTQRIYEHLANMRNNLLHGTWFVGFVSDADPNAATFYLRKYTTSADGLVEMNLPKKAEDLRQLRDDCDIVRDFIAGIEYCLRTTTKITDYFEEREERWVLLNFGHPKPLPDKWRPSSL
jgi:hypothetical protein